MSDGNNEEYALRRLAETAADLVQRGYVVTGELHVVKPRAPGLVDSVATIHLQPAPRIVFEARPLPGNPVAAGNPAPLPTLQATASVVNVDQFGQTVSGLTQLNSLIASDQDFQTIADSNALISESALPLVQAIGKAADATMMKSAGYTGNTCTKCGSPRLVRRGTCEYCEACGESNGCS
jgi:hypothetical protein